MALLDPGFGYVYRPTEPIITKDAGLNPQSVKELYEQVDNLTRAFNGKINMGQADAGTKAGNLDAVYAKAISPGSANTEFSVKHELNRIPTGFDVVSRDKAAIVYDSRRGSWTTSVIYLKCNVATTTIRLRLF